MPTYDYKCTECEHTFELFQSMTEDPIKECPECNGLVKRLIGAGAGAIFKGTGFYQTDYKAKENNGSKKSSVSTSPSTTTKVDTNTSTGSEKK